MNLDLATAAWKHYRREGILSLVREIDKRGRGIIPFQYRIKIRKQQQQIRWGEAAVDQPLRIIFVDPHTIQYNGPRFDRSKQIGTSKSGDWDTKRSEWGGTTFESLKNRFVSEYEWDETKLYNKAKRRIENNGYYLGYSDFDTFKKERLSYLDKLFEKISKNGYKTQMELQGNSRDKNRHEKIPDYHIKTHEVGCNIARDGTFLFNSGKHRLSIAKILDLDKIPIQIIVRHTEWMKQRQKIASLDDPTDVTYDLNFNHPDLQDLLESCGEK